MFVRHSQSDGNVANSAAPDGDLRFYTDASITTPGHQWRLTPTGTDQATAIGRWLQEGFPARPDAPSGFDRLLVSPLVRTPETAANLDLPAAQWMRNQALRERDWGDIGSLPREQFESDPRYRDNARLHRIDPLHWVAPGGESIAQSPKTVSGTSLTPCTGRTATSRSCASPTANSCGQPGSSWTLGRRAVQRARQRPRLLHRELRRLCYSRVCPDTGDLAPRLRWLRTATPHSTAGAWAVRVSEWHAIGRDFETNEVLRAGIPEILPP